MAAGSEAAGAEPKRGGILKFVVPDEPPSFDGHKETTFALIHPIAPFYSVLIRVDPNNPASLTDYACDLCIEMPSATDDGTSYTFKIRKDVKFHDGSKLTAQDVKYSWDRVQKPETKSPYTFVFDDIKGAKEAQEGKAPGISGVRVVDDYTL